MMVESEKLLRAGMIAPGDKFYIVAVAWKHRTLRIGDVVKMIHTDENYFIRASDLTVHKLADGEGNYVLAVEKTE